MPSTDPAHASMLTGLYPRTHGILRNGMPLADPAVATVPARLRALGYRTAAFISRAHLVPSELALRGFDHEDGPEGWQRPGGQTLERALAWLAENGDEPFFVWLHLFDPHRPYNPPHEYRRFVPEDARQGIRMREDRPGRRLYDDSEVETLVALYDGEIAYSDALVGRFLTALRAATASHDPPLILLTGDHGEALGELDERHRYAFHHGRLLYQGIIQVPLVVHWPGRIQGGRIVDGPVELVDLASTLFDLIRDVGFVTQGRSRASDLIDGPASEKSFAFTQRRRGVRETLPEFAVQDERYKLILAPSGDGGELYDLVADPGERHDLSAQLPKERERLRVALERWQRNVPASGSVSAIPEEKLEALRALGYVEDPDLEPSRDAPTN